MATVKAHIVVSTDDENIILRRYDPATGNDLNGAAKITISRVDADTLLTAAGASDMEIKFRWLQFKDSENSCAVTKILYLGSAPILV